MEQWETLGNTVVADLPGKSLVLRNVRMLRTMYLVSLLPPSVPKYHIVSPRLIPLIHNYVRAVVECCKQQGRYTADLSADLSRFTLYLNAVTVDVITRFLWTILPHFVKNLYRRHFSVIHQIHVITNLWKRRLYRSLESWGDSTPPLLCFHYLITSSWGLEETICFTHFS